MTNPSTPTICVSTFGDDWWIDLAQKRAIPSAEAQGVRVIHAHADNLAAARNKALSRVKTKYVIFLDADDELEPGYVEEMMKGSGDIRVPMVRRESGMTERLQMPYVWHCRHSNRHPLSDCSGDCLQYGNWIVIGAMADANLMREVGGWGDEEIYEDWAMWLRMWQAGATFEIIYDAVYHAFNRPDSRNRSGEAYVNKEFWHHAIATSILGKNPLRA